MEDEIEPIEKTMRKRVFFKDPGKKRISAWGSSPNCILVKIQDDNEVFAIIELDNMQTKRLIKELVMQL